MPRPVRGIDPAWLERIPHPTSGEAAKRDREVEQVAHGQKLAEINGEANEVSYTEIVE